MKTLIDRARLHWFKSLLAITLIIMAALLLVGPSIMARSLAKVSPSTQISPSFPTYTTGNFTFSTPIQMVRPLSPAFFQQGGEPEIKTDIFGNIYLTAIQGVPGGVDLWKSTNKGGSFVYLGQPDGAQDKCPTLPQCAGLGGGDDQIDVSNGGYLYISSLWLGNVTLSTSYDGGTGGVVPGQAWEVHPAAAGLPSDDRQWVAAYGPSTVYMTYANAALVSPPGVVGLFVVKSTDGGKTFSAPTAITPPTALDSVNVEGNLVVDPYTGNLYTAYLLNASLNAIQLARSTDGGATWTSTTAYTGPAGTDNRGVFPILAIDRGGNLHLAFTRIEADRHCHVYLTSTANPAAATPTWTTAIQIDNGASTATAVEPWIVAGSAGTVDVTWLGSPAASPDVPSNWHVFFAQVTNAMSGSPTVAQNQAETAVMHNHSICFNGGGCASAGTSDGEPGNRDILEYYTMTLDQDGNANIAYADSINNCPSATCTTNAWFIKQTGGPNSYTPPAAPGAATFAANLVLPGSTGDAEPNMKADSHNCLYSAAPGAPDAWKSTDNGASFIKLPNAVTSAGAIAGGGDSDILPFPQANGARPDQLYYADLAVASVNISKSTDGGATWFSPGPGGAAGEVSVSTDRQWMAGDRNGANQTIYLWEHEFVSQILRMNALTNDTVWSPFANGMTDPELIAPPGSTLENTVPGPCFADPATHVIYGFLGASTVTTNAVGAPAGKLPNIWEADGPGTFTSGVPPGPFTNHPVFKGVVDSPTNPAPPAGTATVGSNTANLFNGATIDSAGNIYVSWATPNARNGLYDVWFASSRDHGKTYYGPFKINLNGTQGNMPWIAAGDNGRVVIVYYGTAGTQDPTTSATNQWNVFFAQSLNATDREPVFTVSQASDHITHQGPICNVGILCSSGTRQLLDFFQVAIGPDGMSNIAYADTGATNGTPHVSYARQIGGPSALANPTFPTCLGNIPLTGVVSRKVHGSAGTFDIDMPLTGTRGVECRGSSSVNDYTLVFKFPNLLTSVGGATVTAHNPTSGTGTVSSSMIDPSDHHNYIVNLTNVSTGQYLTVTLTSVNDGVNSVTNVVGPQIGVLVGDASGNGVVTNADVSVVKAQVANGGVVTSSNFRTDINANGADTNADVSLVKAQVAAGAQLPSTP